MTAQPIPVTAWGGLPDWWQGVLADAVRAAGNPGHDRTAAVAPFVARAVLDRIRQSHTRVQPYKLARYCGHRSHEHTTRRTREMRKGWTQEPHEICADSPHGSPWCRECRHLWPCPTIRLCDEIEEDLP